MSRAVEPPRGDSLSSAADARNALSGKAVCPFCGQQKSAAAEPCPRCTMEDSPATRQATKARIGPWYVLQNRSPSAPGMKFSTLLWLVGKGQVTPRSIVRGPTTYQLWRWAAHVRGLSREFGLCYSCGGAIEKTSSFCAHCERSQEPPANPDVLVESRDAAPAPRTPVIREVEHVTDREDAPEYSSSPMRNDRARARDPRDRQRERERERERELERERDLARSSLELEQAHDAAGAMRISSMDNSAVARQQRAQELMRHGNGNVVSAMELAAAFHDPRADARGARGAGWRALRAFVVLILLAALGGAAFLYFQPQYRQPTLDWSKKTWESIKTTVSSLEWNKIPPDPNAPPPATTNRNRATKTGATGPTVSDNVPPVGISRQPQPIPREPEPRPPKQSPPPQEQPKQQQQSASAPPIVVGKSTTSATPAVVPLNEESAIEIARSLWSQAIDAEAQQDFSAAVQYYEQIKKLPPSAWPGGLQISLDLAKKRAAEK